MINELKIKEIKTFYYWLRTILSIFYEFREFLVLILVCILDSVIPQRRVIGDIREQKISQVAGIDEREERVYRRPPTYLILASKIVRPSTIYQVYNKRQGRIQDLSQWGARFFRYKKMWK